MLVIFGSFTFGVSFEIGMSIPVVVVGDEWRYVLGWVLGLCECGASLGEI